jgi:ParB-like nuclease domain
MTEHKPTKQSAPSPPPKSWRDVIAVHPAAELFPLIDPEDLQALANDIQEHGLRQPCCLLEDENGDVVLVDGRNRLDALALLGEEITLDNTIIFERFPADSVDAYARVVSLNLRRRHLSTGDKRKVISKWLAAQPESPDRHIASQVKVDHKTVAAVRKKKEATGEIPQLKKRTGKDGKARKRLAQKKATKTAHAEAAAQTMPGSSGPMLPPPPTTTGPDPFADYPELPACLDRRPKVNGSSPPDSAPAASEIDALRERVRELGRLHIAAESRVQELEAENAALRAEIEALRAPAATLHQQHDHVPAPAAG